MRVSPGVGLLFATGLFLAVSLDSDKFYSLRTLFVCVDPPRFLFSCPLVFFAKLVEDERMWCFFFSLFFFFCLTKGKKRKIQKEGEEKKKQRLFNSLHLFSLIGAFVLCLFLAVLAFCVYL